MPARSARSRSVSETQLMRAARAAAKHAYAPYSKFRVGAAVLTGTNEIFAGCNVENASYGLCNCAERTAIFNAVAAGQREIRCVVVYTPTPKATAPCGACRQVIYEFGPAARVISVCDSGERIDTTIEALLPRAFGPADLAAK
jgi:cytidine deaminase